jgi:hypothetical protein
MDSRFVHGFLLSVLILLTTQCGGGEGGNGDDVFQPDPGQNQNSDGQNPGNDPGPSPQENPLPATMAGDLSTNIPADENITFTFTETQDPHLQDGFVITPYVEGDLTWENGGRRLVFDPDGSLPADTFFWVTLGGSDAVYRFKTGGGMPKGIGPAGGTITVGQVTLTIPDSVLPDGSFVGLRPVATYPYGAVPATVFEISDLAFTARVVVAFDPSLLPDDASAATLMLARLEADTWVPVEGAFLDVAAAKLSCEISGSGVYGLKWEEPDDAITVYVVDDNPGGNRFLDLPEAIGHLQDVLPAGQRGRVVLDTDRLLTLDSLSITGRIGIRPARGKKPKLAGSSGTLPVSAGEGASVHAVAFTTPVAFATPGGLELLHNSFTGAVTVMVSGAAPVKAATLGGEGGVRMAGNTSTGDLTLDFKGGVSGGAYTVADNSFSKIGTSGALSGDASLALQGNIVPWLDLKTGLSGSASCAVQGHASLWNVDTLANLAGTPSCTYKDNVVGEARLKFEGVAAATVRMESNDIQNGDFEFKVAGLQLDSFKETYDALKMAMPDIPDLMPTLAFRAKELKVGGSMELVSGDNTKLTAGYETADFQEVNVDVKGEARVNLAKEVSVGGDFTFSARGDTRLDDTEAVFKRGVSVQAYGVKGEVVWKSQASQFQGPVKITSESPNVSVNLTESFFVHAGKMIIKVLGSLFGASVNRSVVAAQGAENQISMVRVTGLEGLQIEGASVPVTIDGCDFSSTVKIYEVAAPVTFINNLVSGEVQMEGDTPFGPRTGMIEHDYLISGNTITYGLLLPTGLLVSSISSATITDNDISVSGGSILAAGGSALSIDGSRAVVERNVLSGYFALGIGPEGEDNENPGVVMASGNTMTGAIGVGKNSFASFTSNTIEGSISDVFGGLTSDPVGSNGGLSPDDVLTKVDFDGNGCADYPPALNQINPATGACLLEGVPVPALPAI